LFSLSGDSAIFSGYELELFEANLNGETI